MLRSPLPVARSAFHGLAAFLSLAALPAQEPGTTASPPIQRSDVSGGLAGVGTTPDGLFGRGAHYRVEFGSDGVIQTPILGPDAPRTWPLRMAVRSIGRGEATAWERASTPRRAHDSDSVTYFHATTRLGAIEERYQTRADGLELSVLLPRPIAGTGALRVGVATRSDLSLAPAADPNTLSLLDPDGREVLHIGAVTGIDASGKRCQGSLQARDGGFDMLLPAGFVDTATWPVLIDPLIGGGNDVGFSNADFEADVAALPTAREYLVVFESRISQAQGDVWAVRVDADNGSRRQVLPIAIGADWQQMPAAASWADGNNTRAYVAYRSSSNGNNPQVRMATYDANSGTVTGDQVLAQGVADQPGRIDVGVAWPDGFQRTAPSAVVVWSAREVGTGRLGYVAARVGPGNGASQRFVPVAGSGGLRNIAICKSGGTWGKFLVVGDGGFGPQGSQALYVQRLDVDLGTSAATITPGDYSDPDVDGNGEDALVVFVGPDSSGSLRDSDILGCHYGVSGAGAGNVFRVDDDIVQSDRPAVTYFGSGMYGTVWNDLVGASGSRQCEGVNVARDFDSTCGVKWLASTTYDQDTGRVNACSMYAAGGRVRSDRYPGMFVEENHNIVSRNRNILGWRFEAFGGGGPIQDLGGGCGVGGILSAHGPMALGNREWGLDLRNAPLLPAYGLLSVDATRAPSPPEFQCQACRLLLPTFTVYIPLFNGNGTAFISVPVTCDPAAIGVPVRWQFLTYEPNLPATCGWGPFQLSNILSTTHGR